MPVYVDNFKGKFRGMVMCHMTADSEEELHAFAKRLGLKREWCQKSGKPDCHYDISQSIRRFAVRFGAIEETCADTIKRIQRKRGGLSHDKNIS